MASRWFRVPVVDVDAEGAVNSPKYSDLADAFAGVPGHPDGSPAFVVRFFGDDAALDDIASKSDVIELDGVPVEALNQMVGVERTAAEWNDRFHAGDS